MAVLSLVCSAAFWPALVLLADALRCQRVVVRELAGVSFFVVLTFLLVSVVLGGGAAIRINRSRGRLTGRGLAQLGMGLGLMNALLGISVLPNLIGVTQQSKYDQGLSETRTAVSQVIVYANRNGVYPSSLKVLRESGYGNIRDRDPWGNAWVLSPALSEARQPRATDDVYIYSRGPRGAGSYGPGTSRTGQDGAVGYSSLHGAFKGC